MTELNRPTGTTGFSTTGDSTVAFDGDLGTQAANTLDDAADKAAAGVGGAKQTLKEEAGKLSAKATEKARGLADEGKARATGALDEFSKLMEDAAGTVDEKLGEQYGQYARSAAQAISGFSDSLRDKDVEDLLDDARAFVRKSPAVAIGTAAALGFVLARIVKAGVDTTPAATTPTTVAVTPTDPLSRV